MTGAQTLSTIVAHFKSAVAAPLCRRNPYTATLGSQLMSFPE